MPKAEKHHFTLLSLDPKLNEESLINLIASKADENYLLQPYSPLLPEKPRILFITLPNTIVPDDIIKNLKQIKEIQPNAHIVLLPDGFNESKLRWLQSSFSEYEIHAFNKTNPAQLQEYMNEVAKRPVEFVELLQSMKSTYALLQPLVINLTSHIKMLYSQSTGSKNDFARIKLFEGLETNLKDISRELREVIKSNVVSVEGYQTLLSMLRVQQQLCQSEAVESTASAPKGKGFISEMWAKLPNDSKSLLRGMESQINKIIDKAEIISGVPEKRTRLEAKPPMSPGI